MTQQINQCSMLLNHLMKKGNISRTQAKDIGITKLSARVCELRNMGCDIVNRDGHYYLKKYAPATPRNRYNDPSCPFSSQFQYEDGQLSLF